MNTPSAEIPDIQISRQISLLQALLSKVVKPPTQHPFSEVAFSQREILLLKAIGDNGEMIMSDLAAEIEAPLSTVTRMVDRLEAKGFLERSRSEEDRRIVVVRLSGGKGKVLLDAFLKFRQEMARRMLEPLSLGEREILLELMGKMVASLNEAQPAR